MDSYLILRTPKGHKTECLGGIARAKADGWEGVCFEIGTGSMQDPISSSWSDFTDCVRAAVKANLKIRFRGQLDAPSKAYQNGIPIGPSGWSKRYANNAEWNPYRPPIEVARAIGKEIWSKAYTLAADICKAEKKDPLKVIQFIATNENGVGGANGPWLGRYSEVKAAWDLFNSLWKQYQINHSQSTYQQARNAYIECLPISFWVEGAQPNLGGYVDQEFFRLLRAALENCTIPKQLVWPESLESAFERSGGVYDAQREAGSHCGPDATWIYQNYPRVMINRYGPASVSPEDAAIQFETRYKWSITTTRTNPLWATVPIEVCEGGLKASNAPSLQIAQCRNSVLRKMREINRCGWFCERPMGLSSGYELYDKDGKAIGGPVGPRHALIATNPT